MNSGTNDGTFLISIDPWLESHREDLKWRYRYYEELFKSIALVGGLDGDISHGHQYYGFVLGTRDGQPGTWYREWAPGASKLALVGDFNGWNRDSHPMKRNQWGAWEIFVEAASDFPLEHGSRVKVHVVSSDGASDRIPAYAQRVIQDPNDGDFVAVVWTPPNKFPFSHDTPTPNGREGLRIYEAHVGMALEEERVGTFAEFTHAMLPRIKDLGYNAIQLMGIMEHPYYGSFGYHVSSFYAVSSRFGTPDELKQLIDTAHGLGIRVLLDLVHSHAVKNTQEGINRFDGTDYQYFHSGPKGEHVAWDSLVFNYSKFEVQRFLLSNVRYWLEEFRFDGFRFDGVTSMIYLDHGLSRAFTSYADYFGLGIDHEAVAYLQLSNELAHSVRPDCVTIAEEVSGMPGLARKVSEGGIGFDYRLAMGMPDYWIELIQDLPDEQWNLGAIYSRLLDRRAGEKHVGYAESHDQALVGDKTIAFRLMDQAMYWHMHRDSNDLIVDRGLALHKMIRLITFSLAGEAYLNFMGNEFGHPEWVDFPREGNGFSYKYARRQWSLAENPDLLYAGLQSFDKAMNKLDSKYQILTDGLIEQLAVHEDTKQLIFRHGALVFAFNFHPTNSYADLRIPVPDAEDYCVILSSDDSAYSGHGRVAIDQSYGIQSIGMYGRANSVQIYLPSRSAQVLAPRSLAAPNNLNPF